MSDFAISLRQALVRGLEAPASVALGLLCGWLVVSGHASSKFVGCLIALLVLAVITMWNPGISAGLLVLSVMNGLPGIDLEQYTLAGGLRLSDGAVMLLAGGLAVRIHARGASKGPWARRSAVWGFALGSWWLIVLLRTNLIDGVPLIKAFLFGRDFVYFAILLPLLTMALRGRRELVGCIGTLFGGALLFSVGQFAITAAGASLSGWPGWFVHTTTASESKGVTRVYAIIADAIAPTAAFGLGLAVMPPRKRFARTTGIVLFLVAIVSTFYSLTRALYIGTAVALLIATILWLLGGRSVNAVRRAMGMLCTTLLVLLLVIEFRPLTSSVGSVGAASKRAASTITEFHQRTGNIGYRYHLDHEMLDVLGSNWPVGLGFLHPDSRPVAELPAGSIRNDDTGVMNSLMTMGAVGTVLIYLAPVAILFAVVRRWRAIADPDQLHDVEWFFFGATMWIIIVLVTSISLVTLFTVSGLMLSATVLACAARLLDETQSHAKSEPRRFQPSSLGRTGS